MHSATSTTPCSTLRLALMTDAHSFLDWRFGEYVRGATIRTLDLLLGLLHVAHTYTTKERKRDQLTNEQESCKVTCIYKDGSSHLAFPDP